MTKLEKIVDEGKLLALYQALVDRGAPKPGSFSSLDADGRRAYFSTARRKNRAREKQAKEAGSLPATTANIRDVLADAALMMLATGSPGTEQILTVLASAFASRPGIPVKVETMARNGKMKPKIAIFSRP